jgi:hypothetical protein
MYYENALFENGELKLDVVGMIPDNMEMLKQILPNKIVVLHKQDLYKLLGM